MTRQPRIPGMDPPPRRPRGRAERSVDELVKAWRRDELLDERLGVIGTAMRALAASVDRQEHNPDRSEHVLVTAARALATTALAVEAAGAGDDAAQLTQLAAAVRAAMRDTPDP